MSYNMCVCLCWDGMGWNGMRREVKEGAVRGGKGKRGERMGGGGRVRRIKPATCDPCWKMTPYYVLVTAKRELDT